MGIDRQRIVEHFFPAVSEARTAEAWYGFDLAKAKEHLAMGAQNPQYGTRHPEIHEVLVEASTIADVAKARPLYAKANNAIKAIVPKHPYTQNLIESIPVLGRVRDELAVIPGTVPSLVNLPSGCRFAARCRARIEYNLAICTEQKPDILGVAPGHKVRCWLHRGDAQ